MVLLSHVAAGAAIGKLVPNIYISVPLALFSHFVLDMIPHVQEPTDEGYIPNRKTIFWSVVDLISTVIFVSIISRYKNVDLSIFLPIFTSVLPDLLDISRYNKFLLSKFKKFYDFHDKIQNETKSFLGYLTQILLVVISFLLIVWSR